MSTSPTASEGRAPDSASDFPLYMEGSPKRKGGGRVPAPWGCLSVGQHSGPGAPTGHKAGFLRPGGLE